MDLRATAGECGTCGQTIRRLVSGRLRSHKPPPDRLDLAFVPGPDYYCRGSEQFPARVVPLEDPGQEAK